LQAARAAMIAMQKKLRDRHVDFDIWFLSGVGDRGSAGGAYGAETT
jgi:hypothetical protein